MTLTRYEPWSVFHQLHNDINRLFDARPQDESNAATADWAPLVDIVEFSDRFELSADLPGVNADAVDITLENGVLTISGTREQNIEEGAERRRLERVQGRFYRRFTLPETVDAENVSARSDNGVLFISIPKQPSAKPVRIKVN